MLTIESSRRRNDSVLHRVVATVGAAAIGVATILSLTLAAATPTFAATAVSTATPAVSLGSAATYLVLGQQGVTSTGATTVSGDLGIGAGSTLVGFPPGLVGGSTHLGDAAATQALADAKTASGQAAALTPTAQISGDVGGTTFPAGVYHAAGAVSLSTMVTMDAAGDPNATFVFQLDAALSTAATSAIVLANGAQASHVFWAVTGAAGLGASSIFSGTLLAVGAVNTGDSTRISGHIFSQAAVTLTTNIITFTSAGPAHITIDGGDRSFNPSYTPILTGTLTTSSSSNASVTVTIAGQTLAATVAGGTGSWSVTATTLTDGTYTVGATVTDPVGNLATATQALIVGRNSSLVSLGTAATYTVFGGGGITSTGASAVSGDLGTSPSASVTADPAIAVGGNTHLNDATAITARTDLDTAYADAKARTPTQFFTGDQGGHTFTGGVFHTDAAFALTGTLTLDAQSSPDAVFLFQVVGAFTTAAGSRIVLANGAQASHVFWQTTGATGLGANSSFVGTILAAGAINAGDGSRIGGQALAQGAVTLANNTATFTTAAPPKITIDGGDRSFSPGHTPTLTGTVTTSVTSAATVTVSVAGQTLAATVAGGSGSWSVTATTIADGTYTVGATVTDPVGNRATATQIFSVGRNASLVSLGTAASFSVLAGGGVTSTNTTSVSGDLGTSPSATVTENPPVSVGGSRHLNDSVAIVARTDMDTAYADAKTRTPTRLFAGDLNGQTFTAGVFHTDAAFALTGTLTLDAQNNPDAVFLFQVGGAFSTAAASRIALAHGALASHVFWQVVGGVTTGANSSFVGTILGGAAITTGDFTTFSGRLLGVGLVTFSNNTITNPPPDPTVSPSGTLTIAVPSTSLDLGTVFAGDTVTGHFGQVTVTDTRDTPQGNGWVATVTAAPFSQSAGGPVIPATAVSYDAGVITHSASATYTVLPRTDLTNPQSVVSTNAAGANTAHWNPTITVVVPDDTNTGTYTTTFYHSVT